MKREICMAVMMLGFAIVAVAGLFWMFIRIDPLGWTTFFGLGLMVGIKTVKPAKEVVAKCLERGVLCLTAKDKVRLLPALNIPMDDLCRALDILKEVCAE